MKSILSNENSIHTRTTFATKCFIDLRFASQNLWSLTTVATCREVYILIDTAPLKFQRTRNGGRSSVPCLHADRTEFRSGNQFRILA